MSEHVRLVVCGNDYRDSSTPCHSLGQMGRNNSKKDCKVFFGSISMIAN